jgi:hypothetical protein
MRCAQVVYGSMRKNIKLKIASQNLRKIFRDVDVNGYSVHFRPASDEESLVGHKKVRRY